MTRGLLLSSFRSAVALQPYTRSESSVITDTGDGEVEWGGDWGGGKVRNEGCETQMGFWATNPAVSAELLRRCAD